VFHTGSRRELASSTADLNDLDPEFGERASLRRSLRDQIGRADGDDL